MTPVKHEYKNLLLEKKELGIYLLKINRPEALNALNTETLNEMYMMLTELEQDIALRVLILTGAGEKAFIAGADISEMKDKTHGEGVEFARVGHTVAKKIEQLQVPVIAAVHGFALGGGTEMASACDFIIASERAVFGQPEVGLGIIPGFGGCYRLQKHVGLARAKELIYTGRKFKAEEAKAIGLVLDIYPVEGFLEKVIELAKTIALQSTTAVQKAKELMNEFSETVGLNPKIDKEAFAFGRLMGTHDQREGMTAFLEKRKVQFQGLKE